MNKLPKISECCGDNEFRPVFSKVLISKEFIIATDAHVAIKYKVEEFFDKEFIKKIPEKGILVYKDDFKKAFQTHKEYSIEFKSDDILKITPKGKRSFLIEIDVNESGSDCRFPNTLTIFNGLTSLDESPLTVMTVDPAKLMTISNALGGVSSDKARIEFKSGDETIVTKLSSNGVGILMLCKNSK